MREGKNLRDPSWKFVYVLNERKNIELIIFKMNI